MSGCITGRPWTADEDDLLRARYAETSSADLARLLDRPSARAVREQALRLGLSKRPPWSTEDDRRLRFLWLGPGTLADLAATFSRAPAAVYKHAREIGLPFGVPEGHETLKGACRRTGFDVEQIRAIVEWGHVQAHPVRRRTPPYDAPRRQLYVWPEDIDEAIAEWMACELVTQAAKARRLCRRTLQRWLAAAGERPPTKGKHWRVPSETIDRVVSERRAECG